MATGVSLSYFCLSPLNRPTPKPPTGCKYMCHVSYVRRVIANFVLKCAIFRYHGNRGQSEQFLTVTFKQANPQNPLLGASIWVKSLM